MNITVTTTMGRTIAAFLEDQVETLCERGHSVTLLCAATHELGTLPERLGVDVATAPWTRPLAIRSLPQVLRATRRLPALRDADLVYVHTAIAATLTRLVLATRRDRPVVVYCAHGFAGAAARPWFRRFPPRMVEAVLARFTDVLIVMNDEDEEWARRRHGLRVVRVPSVGLELPERLEASAAHSKPGDPLILLTMAELTRRKRIHLVLEALAELPAQFELRVAGSGPEEAALRERADQLGLADRVEFIGHTLDPLGEMRRADVFVSSSEQEGLARSVLEAMSVGTPVVGVDARGVSDLIGKRAGIVVKSADGASLAAAVELCAIPNRRQEIVSAAYDVVAAHALAEITPLFVASIETAHRRP
jgi:glycosyltransferase involved in cell wall biosynthesis